MDKKRKILLAVSAIFTLGICAIMNAYLLPAIETTTGGLRAFDMNAFGYGFVEAKNFVEMLSDKGLDLYLHAQLPLDFFYPICYTTFFVLAFKALKVKKGLFALAIALPVFDYTENIFSIIMLKTDFSKICANIAATVTVCKSMIMYIIFIILIVYLIKLAVKARRNKKKNK